MSGSIKTISRPIIDNKISSIFTAAQAANMKGFDPICPYLIACLETLFLFDRELKYGNVNKNQLKDLLVFEKQDNEHYCISNYTYCSCHTHLADTLLCHLLNSYIEVTRIL